jgi:hypothetical protein
MTPYFMRMQMQLFTPLTNAFSKEPTNLNAALAFHRPRYNPLGPWRRLRVSPALKLESQIIFDVAKLLTYGPNVTL